VRAILLEMGWNPRGGFPHFRLERHLFFVSPTMGVFVWYPLDYEFHWQEFWLQTQ
jgi:hypothetical protein